MKREVLRHEKNARVQTRAAKDEFNRQLANQTPRDKAYYKDQLANHGGDHLALMRAWHENSAPGDQQDMERRLPFLKA